MFKKLLDLFKPIKPELEPMPRRVDAILAEPVADTVTETMTSTVKKNVAAKTPAVKKPRVKKQ
jgi:hypothetical protein